MLAHKVDGENPAGYSDLPVATWKLEKRMKSRDPLPQKTAVMMDNEWIQCDTVLDPRELIPLM